MSLLQRHPFFTTSAKWSFHGLYHFADSKAYSLEGRMDVNVEGQSIQFKKTLWILAEKPYKATMTYDLSIGTDDTITLQVQHSELGRFGGCVVPQETCVSLILCENDMLGNETMIRDSDHAYREHGCIVVGWKPFASWTAVYKQEK